VCATGEADFATLGEAIAMSPSGTRLVVCPGVYSENLAVTGQTFELDGAGADATILDGSGLGTALTIGGGADVTLEGFTVRGGFTPGAGAGIACLGSRLTIDASTLIGNHAMTGGGGLHADGCTLELVDARFEANEGTTQGGGALLVGSTGEIRDARFVDNLADDGGGLALVGGAVDVRTSAFDGNLARVRGGALYQDSDALVEDCAITGNASHWTGGGVHIVQHAPTFRGNTIRDNTAVLEGGGLYLHQSHALLESNVITGNAAEDDGGGIRLFESEAHLERNHIAANVAAGDGGGLKMSHLPNLLVDNDLLDNEAGGAGGGIEDDNSSSVIRGGLVSGNQASVGGGLHVMLGPWSGATIEGVRIVENNAWHGGGVYLDDNFQPVALRQLTIERNTADLGAGLYTTGTPLTLANSRFTGNDASSDGGGIYVAPSEPWTEPCPCPPVDPPVDVEFVVLHGNLADTGAAVWIGAPRVSVASSILSGHAGNAVTVAAAAPAWRYNDTFPATFAGMAAPTGEGNLATDPGFTAATTGDFTLLPTSACIDAGDPTLTDHDGSRADMGVFAGPEAP
jgi:hypothetical protein